MAIIDCTVDKNPSYREEAVATSGNCSAADRTACDLTGDGIADYRDRDLFAQFCGKPSQSSGPDGGSPG